MDWKSFLETELEYVYRVTAGLFDQVDDAELDWRLATGENWMTTGR